ncbi:MAG: hypothetical protein PW789_18300 [Edaphobacter sp.]|uniref:hypothetical protein n=1 Tax=Edaphobacter sp. TaxID=1934404 RepID=UPI0023999B17|nr:hypothetical protein [Edaphobacter sp.]MDE1178529.1 hypothetical protein [Edaphobacter sp.]
MRRSVKVAAPLLAATAVTMLSSGCRTTEMQRCVDENNHVVDDNLCANLPPASGGPQNPNSGGYGYVPYRPLYRYYYGGWGGYTPGTLAGGGSLSPGEGHSYTTSRGLRTGTARGGFGGWFSTHSSSGHAGGGGE